MRSCTLILIANILLVVRLSSGAPAVVKLTLVIPEGHKVTDVNLRFENQKIKPEESFEDGAEDDDDERPSFGKPKTAGVGKEANIGRQRNDPNMVETFSVVAKKPGESHNTINRVIKLPGQNLVTIRK